MSYKEINRFDLPTEDQSKVLSVEKVIKEKYLSKIELLSMTELRAFKKHKYKIIMINEMKGLLPEFSDVIISEAWHYISNALKMRVKGH